MKDFLIPDTLLAKVVIIIMIVIFVFYSRTSLKIIRKIQNYTEKDNLSKFEFEFETEIDRLKTIASTFIIMGLLGSFFGIAESFVRLSSIVHDPGRLVPNLSLTISIQQLLVHLRSSFAPSIYGVFFTLISIYLLNTLYKKYSKIYLNIISETRPEEKINQAVKTLEEATNTLKKVLEDVKNAASENYEKLKDSMNELVKNIQEFNEQLKPSSDNLKNLNVIIQKQNELAISINQTREKFENLYKSINNIEQKWDGTLKKWEQISDLAEEKYSKLNEPLQQILDEINEMSKTLNNLEKELKETINGLSGNVKKIPESLEKIRTTILNSFKPPIENSAEKINQSFENFIRFTKDFVSREIMEIKSISNEIKSSSPIENKTIEQLNNNINQLNKNLNEILDILSFKKIRVLINKVIRGNEKKN